MNLEELKQRAAQMESEWNEGVARLNQLSGRRQELADFIKIMENEAVKKDEVVCEVVEVV